MAGIDLSTLNKADLLRLSAAARARGNGMLADRIDWEIAARSGHRGQAVAPAADLEPTPDAEAGDFESADVEAEGWAPVYEPEAQPAGRGHWGGAALVVLGAVAGGVVTAGGFLTLAGSGAREVAAVTDVITVPALPPATEMAALPIPSPVVATPRPARASAPPRPRPEQQARSASEAGTLASAKAGCAGFATTAERLVCSDPQFGGLAQRMAEARRRAVAVAPEDPRVADESWWNRARAEAGDSATLARLIERRIRVLETVSAEAREEPIF